jgi:hypothetical protein
MPAMYCFAAFVFLVGLLMVACAKQLQALNIKRNGPYVPVWLLAYYRSASYVWSLRLGGLVLMAMVLSGVLFLLAP